MSSANWDSFTSSFQILISFLSYYHLNALARTDGTVLGGTSDSGHPVSFPDVRGKTFNPFTIEYGVSFVLSSLMPFVSLKYGPSIHNLSKSFYDEQMLNFIKCILHIY